MYLLTQEAVERELATASRSIYPEPQSDLHSQLTEVAMDWFLATSGLKSPALIIDVGSGSGVVMDALVRRGFPVHYGNGGRLMGMNYLASDANECRRRGFICVDGDMHDLEHHFRGWCGKVDAFIFRHVLEHSIMPTVVLQQAFRLLAPGGYVYVETPAPDSSSHHDQNVNHWFTLTQSNWAQVLLKCGFECVVTQKIDMNLVCGPDTYFMFSARRNLLGTAN